MPPEINSVITTTLRRNTREVLKLANVSLVVITRYGRPTYVLMSAAEFERIGSHGAYPSTKLER